VKKAEIVGKLVDEPIYEIKDVELLAIQSKKYYKKTLSKKDINTERTYKKYFRSYKIYKFFYF